MSNSVSNFLAYYNFFLRNVGSPWSLIAPFYFNFLGLRFPVVQFFRLIILAFAEPLARSRVCVCVCVC